MTFTFKGQVFDQGFIAPFFPPFTVLTDRDDGTRWLLQYNTVIAAPDAFGHISITDTFTLRKDMRIYPAWDEPAVPGGGGRVRLFVRGGRLGMDYDDSFRVDRDQHRIMARLGLQREFREIILPTDWDESFLEPLAWVPVDIRGEPL